MSDASWRRDRRYFLRLIYFFLVSLIVALMITLPMVHGYVATLPAHTSVGDPPDADYNEVVFASRDGIQLSGWYHSSENGAAIILTHGYGGNRTEMLSRADILREASYGVLLYDVRGHGESGGDVRAFGWAAVNDLLGAVDFVQNQANVNPERIGAVGFSVGGQITLRATAQTNAIKALVVDGSSTATVQDIPAPVTLLEWASMPTGWLYYEAIGIFSGVPKPTGVMDSIPAIAPRPVLFISTGTGQEQRITRQYYEAASEPKSLFEIPEAGHGAGLNARPDEYAERMLLFFGESLGDAAIDE